MVKVGFPIRKSPDQSSLTAPRRLSQRATSSSPVHAKASTKCSYLTLENPHHQRQACIMPASCQVRTIISARFCNARVTDPLKDRSRYVAASIKNPFTMSKRSQMLRITARKRQTFVFISGKLSVRAPQLKGWWSLSGSNR